MKVDSIITLKDKTWRRVIRSTNFFTY